MVEEELRPRGGGGRRAGESVKPRGAAGASVDPLEELSGTSLRAYLALLLSPKPLGVRELQRLLGLRSPSTARHHLEKLKALGLVAEEAGGYRALPPRRGLLAAYAVIKGRLVPKSMAALAFTLVAAVAYTLLPGRDPVAALALWASALLQASAVAEQLGAARRLGQLARPGKAGGGGGKGVRS